MIQIVVNNEHNLFVVDDDGGLEVYKFIQDAVDDAGNGDGVYVHNGTYYENIVIERSIVLTGENKDSAIIDGYDIDNVIHIIADNVEITGFTIQNASSSGEYFNRNGIYVKSSKNIIHGNHITNNTCGILLEYDVSDSLIYHNNFIKRFPKVYFNAMVVVEKNGNYWYNSTLKQGNYWSDYKGIDILPPWGIGDIPKRIYPFLLGHKDIYPLMKPVDSGQSVSHSISQSNSQSQSSVQQSTTIFNSQTLQVIKTKTR